MQIKGSGALVVGGASGLGESTARRLHCDGARVVIADLDGDKGRALASELGDGAAFVRVDVTDPDQVQEAVAAAAALPGGVRISVCCAGINLVEKLAGGRGPHSLESFEAVIGVNLIGTFNVMRLVTAGMLGNEPSSSGERGVCVNTASVAAFEGQVGQIAYAASKGAIVAMTLPAARDLARAGVRVCTIAPGIFGTPMLDTVPEAAREALAQSVPFPARLGRADEYASLAVEIISNEMLNGEVIRLDGALRMGSR
ncbi:MAG: SDR family NAD(P)-dependent oxidoreductase [Solirubrobacteraceae bacterium]|jgi:NAD(P)-dependent dehydrogenase (short-subunit alcohol dehydrogenase family)